MSSFHSRSRRRSPGFATRRGGDAARIVPSADRARARVEASAISRELAAAIASSGFATLGLAQPLVRAVVEEGYAAPTPVQAGVIPHALAGRDILACAQTGTGKTAAFLLPILHRLDAAPPSGRIRALVLTPTRELAAQIGESLSVYGRHLGLGHAVVYGGVSQHRQELSLRARPEVLVATPGRLIDLMQQGLVKLDDLTHFVLDEADRMLDMGFVHDVRRIVAALPRRRCTMLFSATISREIDAIATSLLASPVRVSVTPTVTAATTIEQSVIFVAKAEKRALLQRLLAGTEIERALVFTRTKHGANRLCEHLVRVGVQSAVIHGNKSQRARENALSAFRRGMTRVLVATDVAARGIDVERISHVINFDVPNVAESYVHRIGRTGRAGAIGKAISFCDRDERGLIADIERLIRHRLPIEASDAGVSRGAVDPMTAICNDASNGRF